MADQTVEFVQPGEIGQAVASEILPGGSIIFMSGNL